MKNITPSAQFRPIKCPNCGNTELAYVPEYHKYLLLRIFRGIFLIAAIILGSITIPQFAVEMDGMPPTFAPMIITAVIAGVLSIIILIKESRTHIKAICQNCGNIWLID